MSKRLPNLSLVAGGQVSFLGQGPQSAPHSGEIEQAIGEEQLEILHDAYEDAKRELARRRDALEALAQRLLAQEKLEPSDLLDILGPRPDSAAKPPVEVGGDVAAAAS
jgi:ATP-dependent Zn protease